MARGRILMEFRFAFLTVWAPTGTHEERSPIEIEITRGYRKDKKGNFCSSSGTRMPRMAMSVDDKDEVQV